MRFAIAQDYKVQEAFTKWKNWVDWRLTYKPEEINENEECIQKQKKGMLKWFGYDKDHRPCLYYKAKNHQAGLATIDESVRYFVYMIEKGCNEADKLGSGKLIVVFDRKGYERKNHDAIFETRKKLFPILQDYYPERLHLLFVIGVNWFIRAILIVVRPFLSKKTANKLFVLTETQNLLKYFASEEILPEYRG